MDFLGLLPEVDRERIGVIGICGFGGMALNAAAVDKRIKAVGTTVMYDMSWVMSRGYFDSTTLAQRTQLLTQLSTQRWADAERGFYPRSVNSNGSWTVTTPLSFMNMPLMTYIAEISPRPVLIMAGEKAHSRYFSEDAYKAAVEPKKLVSVPGAIHADLYDRLDKIPFDKLADFFQQHLR